MTRIVSILFCVFLSLSCFSQEEFITPSKFITRMPFQRMTGGIVMLKAQLAPFNDTLNFILDTGSGGISLDSTTAAYFKLEPVASERIIRGIAGMKKVSFLYNRQLRFPGLDIDTLHFHINDYTILNYVYGERIDGIIGYSVFSRYIVKINYDSSYVEFWTRGLIKYPRGGYLIKPEISMLPVLQMRVKDDEKINARFLYDMGAGVNMVFSKEFVEDSSLFPKKRKMYLKETEGMGGKVDMLITVVKNVKLGPYKFKKVPVYIFDDVNNVTSYPHLGGLLGSDLLRRFNIIINYERSEIHLLPNSHFKDHFDYAYTGIDLYMVDGDIIIGDVAKDSPAEKAGLIEGDIVIAINNVFGASLNDLKTALQTATNRIKIIIQRDGKLTDFEFKVKQLN